MNYLNKKHENINFPFETKKDNSFSFLDIKNCKEKDKFTTRVFTALEYKFALIETLLHSLGQNIWRFFQALAQFIFTTSKKLALKHSTQKPLLLDFVNLLITFCPDCRCFIIVSYLSKFHFRVETLKKTFYENAYSMKFVDKCISKSLDNIMYLLKDLHFSTAIRNLKSVTIFRDHFHHHQNKTY